MFSGRSSLLLVDDSADIRAAIREMLEHHGDYSILEAADGAEAFAIIEHESVDFMLCDIVMPKMDGLELLEKLQVVGHSVPVIFITGDATKEKAIAAIRLGVVDFIEKPVRSADLFRAIDELKFQVLSISDRAESKSSWDQLAKTAQQIGSAIESLQSPNFLETHLNVLIRAGKDLTDRLREIDDAPLELFEEFRNAAASLRIRALGVDESFIHLFAQSYRLLEKFIQHRQFDRENARQITVNIRKRHKELYL